MTPAPLDPALRTELTRVALLLVVAVLSRLLLLPESPFEVDSVLLIRGVEEFDPTAMRPHPPGYAGVVGLGRLMPLPPDAALRVLSALAVVPLVGFTWAIARALNGRALLAAALVAANPVAWLYGVTENAYALGAAGAAAVVWTALQARRDPCWTWGLLLGLLLGVTGALRPSLLLFLAPIAAWGAGRRAPWVLAGAVPVTAAWVLWAGAASGGVGAYLSSVWTQFTWIRDGHAPGWRLHQLHHFGVYGIQALAGGALLLPWIRRPKGDAAWALLLWAGVPLAFHALVYVAKAGYLLSYLPALAVLVAVSERSPVWARVSAVVASAAWFLLPRPIDVDLDPMPKAAFGTKTWPERIRGELSFLGTASLGRVRTQDRVNQAYTDLLTPVVHSGPTTVVWVDRWDAALAGHHLPGARVIDPRAQAIEVPTEGIQLVVLSWERPDESFEPIVDPTGYGAWTRRVELADLPLTVGRLTAVPVF
jgi:hypothetical protein